MSFMGKMYAKGVYVAAVFSAWHGDVFPMKILLFPLAAKPFDLWIFLWLIPKHFCVLYEGSLYFLLIKKECPTREMMDVRVWGMLDTFLQPLIFP